MLLERRSRRWSAARPCLVHTNIGVTAAAVAGGIAGLGTIGQNLNTHPPVPVHGLSHQHQQGCVGPGERVSMTAPREIPVFRNPRRPSRDPRTRSITVIDEAEASL